MPNPFNTDLDRNPANHQPLTPLTFLDRAASVFPDHTAIVHGDLRRNYAEFYARSRQLASALDGLGIGRGDTVSAVLVLSDQRYLIEIRRAQDRVVRCPEARNRPVHFTALTHRQK